MRVLVEGATRAFLVTYRRYENGVLMPMRLDITITTAKRILEFNARNLVGAGNQDVVIDAPTGQQVVGASRSGG